LPSYELVLDKESEKLDLLDKLSFMFSNKLLPVLISKVDYSSAGRKSYYLLYSMPEMPKRGMLKMVYSNTDENLLSLLELQHYKILAK
jgi:hypothetical protein